MLSASELLDWLGQYQFLTSTQIDIMQPLLISFPDSLATAKEMLRRDWLSAYQVEQIEQGNQADLVIDKYRLRERVGEGAMGQAHRWGRVRSNRLDRTQSPRRSNCSSSSLTARNIV